jgi:HPt (histidine-containing phosphotransfer) domain-containing protein
MSRDLHPADVALLASALSRSTADAAAMAESLGQGGFGQVASLAHRMAGITGMFGLSPVAEAARGVEAAARLSDAALTGERLEKLRALLSELHAADGAR